MKLRIMLICYLALSGCASKVYTQDLLAGGKTWRIHSGKVYCPGGVSKECKTQLNEGMAARAKEICEGPEYRLFSCDTKTSSALDGFGIVGTCYLECRPEEKATE